MAKAIDKIKEWAKENVQLISILPENKNLQVETRLRDILEEQVDEKYYLSDEKTASLVATLEARKQIKDKPPIPLNLLSRGAESRADGLAYCLKAAEGGSSKQHLLEGLPIREATRKGYAVASEGDAVNFQFPESKTRPGRVGKQIANTLEASSINQGVVEVGLKMIGHVDINGNDICKRVYSAEGVSPTVPTGTSENTTPKVAEEVFPVINNRGEIERREDGISTCLDANYGKGIDNHGQRTMLAEAPRYRIRKLTPRECFRLQGFPDYAFDKAQQVNSDSQLYKQAGNSVTVNVIYEIAKRLEVMQ